MKPIIHFNLELEPINYRDYYEKTKDIKSYRELFDFSLFILDINQMVYSLFQRKDRKDNTHSYFNFKRYLELTETYNKVYSEGDLEYAAWLEKLINAYRQVHRNQNGRYRKSANLYV